MVNFYNFAINYTHALFKSRLSTLNETENLAVAPILNCNQILYLRNSELVEELKTDENITKNANNIEDWSTNIESAILEEYYGEYIDFYWYIFGPDPKPFSTTECCNRLSLKNIAYYKQQSKNREYIHEITYKCFVNGIEKKNALCDKEYDFFLEKGVKVYNVSELNFKGTFEKQFDNENENFIWTKNEFSFFENDYFKAVKLDYLRSDYSLLVVLPNQEHNIIETNNRICNGNSLNELINGMEKCKVEIKMPKIEVNNGKRNEICNGNIIEQNIYFSVGRFGTKDGFHLKIDKCREFDQNLLEKKIDIQKPFLYYLIKKVGGEEKLKNKQYLPVILGAHTKFDKE